MSLGRKAIRAALLDTLRNQIVDVGKNVFAGRITPLQLAELPAVVIQTHSGEDVQASEAPLEMRRAVDVQVAIVVQSSDSAADELDDLAAEVDVLLFEDPSFGERVEKFEPTGYEVRQEGEAEQSLMSLITTYRAVYLEELPGTLESNPFTRVDGSFIDNDSGTHVDLEQ